MSKLKPFTLMLLPTGPTTWDREGRIVGGVDLPLAETPEPTESLAGSISAKTPDVILCGPDECSKASAQRIAEMTGAKIRTLSGLADVSMGLWEGVTLSELEERCPTTFKKWRDRPDTIAAPEGEALDEARDRITGEIHRAAMKVRSDHPVVLAVLRPMALALVRGKLEDRAAGDLWSMMDEAAEAAEMHEVEQGALAPAPRRISA